MKKYILDIYKRGNFYHNKQQSLYLKRFRSYKIAKIYAFFIKMFYESFLLDDGHSKIEYQIIKGN